MAMLFGAIQNFSSSDWGEGGKVFMNTGAVKRE